MPKKLSRFLFIPLLVIVLFSACSNTQTQKQSFSFTPENPKPGDKITVSYIADSTLLSSADSIRMFVYTYNTDIIDASSFKMVKNGSVWNADFTAADSAYGMLIKFVSGQSEDVNSGKSYVIKLNDANNKILPGAELGLAYARSNWGFAPGLDRDKERAFSEMKKLLGEYPAMKDKFLGDYLTVAYDFKKDGADSLIAVELSAVENKPSLTKDELVTLAKNYKRINNKEKADKYTAMLKEKYPGAEYLSDLAYREFSDENNFDKKLQMLKQYEKEFPNGDNLEDMYTDLTVTLRNAGDYKKAVQFFNENSSKIEPYYFYYTAEKMINDKKDIHEAEKLLNLGIERGKAELQKSTVKKPKTYTEGDWLESRKADLAMNLYSLGKLEYNNGKLKEALPKLEKAVELTKGDYSQQPVNEVYVQALYDDGQYDKDMAVLSEFIGNGDGTEMMSDLLKKAYIKKNGSDKGYDEYIKKYNDMAKEKMLASLKKEMINMPAPQFKLKDVDGKDISLTDYKGKTVVVDFWATWCGPCKRSFPGMKSLIEKYAQNQNVKFLFVDTFERVDNKKQNAVDYLKSSGYPFHVLLDENNQVSQEYKVSGIPTKFIVDKTGNIRFKSVGFAGNNDALVDEVSAMISMIN